jgi:hypothetical protein
MLHTPRTRFSRCAFLLLLALLAACGTESTLEVTNLTPLPVDVAIRYPGGRTSVVTQGWFRLAAGESRTFVRKFRRVQPEFAVYGHTAGDPAFTRWLHGQGEDGPGRRYFAGDLAGPVATDGFDIRTATAETQAPATRTAQFAAVPAMTGGRAHRVVLKDQRFAEVYRAAVQAGGGDPIQAAAAQIAKLAGALHHQHWFARTFTDPEHEYPFALAGLEDANGPLMEGVEVTVAPQTTIWGDPYPLQTGDRLLSLDGMPVFATQDLLSVLWDHATDTVDGGIRKPMAFTALRNGQEVSGLTTYFFNEDHFEPLPGEALVATVVGGLDALTLGFSCSLRSWFGREFSRARRAWNCQQGKARLRQQHQKSYLAGELISILIPIGGPASLVKGAKGAKVAKALTLGRVGSSLAIATFSTINRGSPLAGAGEVMAEAGKDVLMDVGVAELFATDLFGG